MAKYSPRAGILPSSPIRTMLDPISNMQLCDVHYYVRAFHIPHVGNENVRHTRTLPSDTCTGVHK